MELEDNSNDNIIVKERDKIMSKKDMIPVGKDRIVQVDTRDTYMKDMARYSLYILYNRYVPDIRDGLKPVQRRILTAMLFKTHCTSFAAKRKSAKTVGDTMGIYHPHGDSSIYGAMKPMTNWFECKMPLINYFGNSGSIQGADQAAMRYTESYLSEFCKDCVLGELMETEQVVDWLPTFDNKDKEPDFLPVKVPLLLINGVFSIAIGSKIEVPTHSLNDVIDATIKLMYNPRARVALIPDHRMQCEIVDTDWNKISTDGFGNYTIRGIIDIAKDKKSGKDMVCIKSVPNGVFAGTIVSKINDMIASKALIGIVDIQDESSDEQLDIRLILKHDTDPNYIKQMLYKHTDLEDTGRVNMEVMVGDEIKRVGYKDYLLRFIDGRKNIKFRLYNYRLQTAKTKLHEMDTYIKVLESGDIENIIRTIRKNKDTNESSLIQWLMKKLNITDLQAKFVIHTEIGKLSMGNLNKYKDIQASLFKDVDHYIQMITNEQLIEQEIEQELLDIKAKYNQPRKSIIISKESASGIPSGLFKIILTEANYIRKIPVNEPVKTIKGDNIKFVADLDNAENLLLFDEYGKVFRLPIHKIPFTDRNSQGTDIRLILSKLTSNIMTVLYHPMVEDMIKNGKFYMVIVSRTGMIKRIDLDDIVNATASGMVYSKLNPGDSVRDIVIAGGKSDIVIYGKSKALRIKMTDIPHLKRSTIGSKSMTGRDAIDGMSVITNVTTDVVVVTNKGNFNRFNIAGLPMGTRGRTGNKVIKLGRGEYIINIFSCNASQGIRVYRQDEVIDIPVANIPQGSSISPGVKMCKDVLKCELLV